MGGNLTLMRDDVHEIPMRRFVLHIVASTVYIVVHLFVVETALEVMLSRAEA